MDPFLALYEESCHLRRQGRIDPHPGFQPTDYFFLIVIGWNGAPRRIEFLGRPSEGKSRILRGLTLVAPVMDRTSGILARPLGDDLEYVLDPGPKRESFYARVSEIAEFAGQDDKPRARKIALAIRTFGEHFVDTIDRTALQPQITETLRGRPKAYRPKVTFAIEDHDMIADPVLTDPEVRSVIQPYRFQASLRGVCSRTGIETAIARLHPKIRGGILTAAGAQSSGATLSSHNRDTTQSYGNRGDRQPFNAPMSVDIVEGAADALNYLADFPQRAHTIGSRDRAVFMFAARTNEGEIVERLRNALIGQTSPDVVATARIEMTRISEMFDPERFEVERQIGVAIQSLSTHPSNPGAPEPLDAEGHLNILVLAPQAARLAIVGFERPSIAQAYARVLAWFDAGSIATFPGGRSSPATINQYMNALQGKIPDKKAVNRWSDEKRAIFALDLFLSATMGRPIRPDMLLAAIHAVTHTLRGVEGVLRRAGVADDTAYWTVLRHQHRLVALIKLCLTFGPSNQRYAMPTDLERDNDDLAYLAGRAFAAAVYAQRQALPHALLRFTSMLGAATSAPGHLLPRIAGKSQAHRDKLERNIRDLRQRKAPVETIKLAVAIHRRAVEAMDEAYALKGGREWPATLSPLRQGVFLGGYHQQSLAFYAPRQAAKAGQIETPDGDNAVQAAEAA